MSKQRKAFTLVELLVVIAIIGILFVVLISKVDFATDKAKAAGVQTDFRSYQVAIETVARENAGLSVLVDNDADGEAKYAELEKALNKNLDPKLHVEIDADGKISTEAKDPWKEQYLGAYLAPDADGTVKDRGAIVMYCKGSNLKLGTTAVTENGVVNVTIEGGKETEGADDYSISTIYTYVNGYGEIQTTTKGFSNDQEGRDSANVESPSVSPEAGGPGLYKSGSSYTELSLPWNALIASGAVEVVDGELLVKVVSPDSLPPKNDFDFYYGMMYTNDSGIGLCFNADGSLNLYQDGTISGSMPADTAVYSKGSIDMSSAGGGIARVSPDGLSIEWFGYVLTLGDFYQFEGDLLLPNDGSITSLPSETFINQDKLTGVVIPDSVTVIDYGLFDGCAALTDVVLHNAITDIGMFAFANCANLSNLSIPDSVDGISRNAFANSNNLIEVEDGIQYVDTWVVGSDNTITQVRVKDGIRGIAQQSFSGCSNITSVSLPGSIKYINNWAFQDCTSVTELYFNGTAEQWCNIDFFVRTVNADSNPCSFSSGANYYFNGELLEDLVIPDTVTSIDRWTFANCTSIKSVTLSGNLKSIGFEAFKGCSNLQEVHLNGTIEDWCNLTNASDGVGPRFYGQKDLYFGNVLAQEITIPGNVNKISMSTFSGYKSLTNVTILEGVTYIGLHSFVNCEKLTSIVLPATLTEISISAFENCSNLDTIVFNGTIEQWAEIVKDYGWNTNVPATTVQCSNGNVTI